MSFRGGNKGSGGSNRTLLPFGLDYADILQSSETIEKPQYVLPVNMDPNNSEQLVAKRAMTFAKLMSEGPFYTGSVADCQLPTTKIAMAHTQGEKLQNEEIKNEKLNAANDDDGIERYSDRYKKKQKIGRTIEEHPYQLQFFPEELYSVMGISSKQKKKILSLSKFNSNGGLREFMSDEKNHQLEEEAKLKALKEQMLSQVGHDDDDHKDDEKEEQSEPESVDDEFEDEDDDDYNAEKYFDDGDDDVGDDGGDDEAAF
ncbi:uncharacterized protein LODBEIA_P09930 [Lodderomyces beijingensis]|uniref:DNA-directed RNA polymerase III subunit n=1 Tax=Lodderomyces beijingensis TaxID=1775926 RepID=A0ABP0ZG00_9ASCO